MRTWMLLVLLTACAGAADDPAINNDADANAAEPSSPAPAPERVIPLCDGSPEQTPTLCQELRYGTHGYCNFWSPCAAH